MTELPYSRESEEALIGAVLINPDCYADAAQFLVAEDFYTVRHRWLWEAFAALRETKTPLDLLTICDALEHAGKLAEIGGPAFLTGLLTQTPDSTHAEAYARQVKQTSIRRQMIAAANKIATSAFDEGLQTDKALVDAQSEIARLLAHSTGHEVLGLAPLLATAYDEIKERSEHPAEIWGIPTGLPKYDACTGGQHLGEMTVIAGEPGLGKTWLSLGMAAEMAIHEPGAFFSLEMRKEAIVRRLLSAVGGIRARNMRTGYMDENDWMKLSKAIADLEGLPFYLDDRARDTASLRAALLRLKRDHGIKWFVADYLQLLSDEGRDDNERTKTIGRELKHICNDLDLAGIIINSVNKGGMDRSASEAHAKSNMSGSGQIIHDADLVLFLTEFDAGNGSFYTADEKARMATLWVKKGRELEDPRVKVNLVRKQGSPFWGELAEK